MPRTIVLFVAGMTPQIVTETLYALVVRRGERIDEIRVITTRQGKRRLVEALLTEPDGWFHRFCRDFDLAPGAIDFNPDSIKLLEMADGKPFEDIRTEDDNILAGDQICEYVRRLTRDPAVRVHASAAGGRKTMGIYLTAAMQLFGRARDRLSHVLVSEDFETHPEFFYPPPVPRMLELRDRDGGSRRVSTAEAEIHLADIPFIRLRGVLDDSVTGADRSFESLVREAQEEVGFRDAAHRMVVDPRSRKLSVTGRTVQLTEAQFFFYVMFVRRLHGNEGRPPRMTFEDVTREELDDTLRFITTSRGKPDSLDRTVGSGRFEFVRTFLANLESPLADANESARESFSQALSKLDQKCARAGIPECFRIAREGKRPPYVYAIPVSPDRIVWQS